MEDMTFEDIQNELENLADNIRAATKNVEPKQLGLDERASYGQLLVGDNFIAAGSRNDDRVLQYYGGFEYVDKDCRLEVGSLVIYSAEDERVQGCLDRLEGKENEDDDV